MQTKNIKEKDNFANNMLCDFLEFYLYRKYVFFRKFDNGFKCAFYTMSAISLVEKK